MSELRAIVAQCRSAWARGEAPVLATVVGVRGSAYRRPGARMLVTEEGWKAGSVSGGCLEADVVRRARWLMEHAHAVVRTYDTSADAEGVGASLGCGGEVDVLLEAVRPAATVPLLELFEQVLATRGELVLGSVVAAPDEALLGLHLARLGDQRVSDAPFDLAEAAPPGVKVFWETVAPPLRLHIVGAGHDAIVLAAMASAAGWDVHVVDWRAALATPARFPDAVSARVVGPTALATSLELDAQTAVVVMSHNAEYDRRALEGLVGSRGAGFVGVLGPRRRTDELLDELRARGTQVSADDVARLHAPVGLDLGGDGPGAVATAILAEALACLTGRDAAPLKARAAPIHDEAPREAPARPAATSCEWPAADHPPPR